MGKGLARYPIVVLLSVWIALILWAYYRQSPIDLLKETQVEYIDSTCTYCTIVSDYPEKRARSIKTEVDIIARIDSTRTIPTQGKVLLYILADSTNAQRSEEAVLGLQIGDTLLVRTTIKRGDKIGQFDYGLYLRKQGIVGQGMVWKDQWQVRKDRGNRQRWNPRYWQHCLYERYKALGIKGDRLATLSALTLGYKDDLDPSLRTRFQRSGAAHVLAVSGLHTGIIYLIIVYILTWGKRYKPLYEDKGKRRALSAVVIAMLWGYALMTGLTPSVVRSVVMLSLIEIGKMVYKRSEGINTLLCAAFLILIYRPLDLFSISFQLSFAAVAAILIIVPQWKIYARDYTLTSRIGTWLGNWVIGLVCVSIAAQIGTLPISLCYFGQTANYFLLTNLIALPLATGIVISGMATLVFGSVPIVGKGLVWATCALTDGLNKAVTWIEQLPGACTTLNITPTMAVLLYIAIVSAVLGIKRSLWWLVLTGLSLSAWCASFFV